LFFKWFFFTVQPVLTCLTCLFRLNCLGKFQFTIHPSFWLAVPFSEKVLSNKVAGSRKLTEMLKIAKHNNDGVVHFFTMLFAHRYTTYHGRCAVLAPVSTPPAGT